MKFETGVAMLTGLAVVAQHRPADLPTLIDGLSEDDARRLLLLACFQVRLARPQHHDAETPVAAVLSEVAALDPGVAARVEAILSELGTRP